MLVFVEVVVNVVVGAGIDFIARGVDVNGGGRGAPLGSPLTLLFNGGSSIESVLSFFLFPIPSAPPCEPPGPVCQFLASCSSNACECFSSSFQKKPFPLSPPHLSSFKKARLDDKLWRTELCKDECYSERICNIKGKVYHPRSICISVIVICVHYPGTNFL